MELVVDRRRTMAEAQSQAQQARDRQVLAQLAPSNPSNPLQMGGASDFGMSRRFQSPDSASLVPPPRISRVQPPAPPNRVVRQSPSPYRSPDGVFNFEDEFDYKSSSSGSGMKRLARYYKK
jgi:hypothetical protein